MRFRNLALLALVLVPSLASSTAHSEEPSLTDWIRSLGSFERYDPAVVARRARDPGLVPSLLALAGDATSPVHSQALALAGALCEADPHGLEEPARSRIAARRALVEKLADRAHELDGALDDETAAREAIALARDPLFHERARVLLIAKLPHACRVARRDLATEAAAIVSTVSSSGGALARIQALSVVHVHARARLTAVLARALDDRAPAVRDAALGMVGVLENADELDALLRETGTTAAAAEALAHVTWHLREAAVDRLAARFLVSPDAEVQVAACLATAALRPREAIELGERVAERALASSSVPVHERAVRGLARLPRSCGVRPIARGLARGQPEEVRLRAVELALATRLEMVVPALEPVARDGDASLDLRTAAVRALGELGSGESVAATLEAVLGARGKAEVASLRRAAAEALGRPALRGEVSRRGLARALEDDSPIVRIAATRSLAASEDATAVPVLASALARTGATAREQAELVQALAALRAYELDAQSAVAAALGERPAPAVALAAASYLAHAPRAFAVPRLLDLLEHPDASVRARAHASLLTLVRDVEGLPAAQGSSDPFGYDPSPEEGLERQDAVRRWRGWWARNPR